MKKLIMAVAIASLAIVGACGDDGDGGGGGGAQAACEAYVEALNGCFDTLGGMDSSKLDASTTCAGMDAAGSTYTDYYNCYAEAVNAVDCTDMTTYTAPDYSACTL